MLRKKYVVLRRMTAIIFDECIQHNEFKLVNGLGATSAGFFNVDIETQTVETYGESNSLGLKPDDGDIIILKRILFDE